MNTQVHRHYVADLYGRSGEYKNSKGQDVSKTMFYTQYLADLKITPLKDDENRAYVTHEQKLLLDEYHRRRSESKQALAEFLAELNGTSELVPNSSELSQQAVWLRFAEALATRLAPAAPDPLSPQEQLQRICDRGWQVSTSQLEQILGVGYGAIARHPERFGFVLTKVGQVGREAAWQVQKKNPTLLDREQVN